MPTIAEKLKSRELDLTRAERQLSAAILENYPIPGLGSITELADLAEVSTPTVARMVQKLGFSGYPEFQHALREELREIISNPVEKRAEHAPALPESHMLNRYAVGVYDNIRATLENVTLAEFDALCDLLADTDRRVHIAGGRLSGTLAQTFYLHLQMIRRDVFMIPPRASWAHSVLDLLPGDTLILFDVRRYENATLLLAEMAHERGVDVVLFTDQWRSPIQKLAKYTFAARIAVPSAWDSGVALLLLVESMIAKIQEDHWETVKARTDELEKAFDRTRLFRKFT
ncbi:MurR/RpiR family transcriptional regulator [Tritonibacter horizontis]|uniref:DNA-binding transcriptional regulator HexR n=1 Tax=Tritonibacter horizontis TaxID=1768241 RepID=A0A132C389_9RHOB|nr:MurR/RpiR family transcriptional regulator [Tritonibacter horizontis]KUP94986.1 DNA-binding transcriptional regulator HexR [Tritonibacter horizontis]